MFERFTEHARQSILYAQDESRVGHHDTIGVEHLIAGMTLQPMTIARRALEAVGISHAVARNRVGTIPPSASLPSQKPFTPQLKAAMEMALREALSLGHNFIGTEHLLLGVIRVERKEAIDSHALEGLAELDPLHDVIMGLLGSSRRSKREPEIPDFVRIVSERHVLESAVADEICACCGEPWPCADRRAADEALIAGLAFNAVEQQISDHILEAMRGIEGLGLLANRQELAMHVHGMQRFVIQHMLQRVGGEWGKWYREGV